VEQVAPRTLWRRAGVEQQFGGLAVGRIAFDDIERLVHGATDDRVEELERVLTTQQVEPDECGRGGTKLARLHAPESGRVPQLDSVSEYRRGAKEGERLRLQASEAKPDDPGDTLRPDLQQTRRVLGGQADSLPRDRVQHRADKEWVASRGAFERRGEGVVRLQAVQLARQQGDRGTPERFGANGRRLRVGDQLCDECRVLALTLRWSGCGDNEERHSLEPSR
jgi:hypothetical protein